MAAAASSAGPSSGSREPAAAARLGQVAAGAVGPDHSPGLGKGRVADEAKHFALARYY